MKGNHYIPCSYTWFWRKMKNRIDFVVMSYKFEFSQEISNLHIHNLRNCQSEYHQFSKIF